MLEHKCLEFNIKISLTIGWQTCSQKQCKYFSFKTYEINPKRTNSPEHRQSHDHCDFENQQEIIHTNKVSNSEESRGEKFV